ncbi:MAG: hypothetical protein JW807_05835 [Spirochaetes bacterium]|nr:hypothetical protein [Spirochaetota bacterium]
MRSEPKEDYELIAKHCPSCEALVMARVEKEPSGSIKYSGYRCSRCEWSSPVNLSTMK